MYTKLNLIELTGSGVYCLINDSSKKVYIGYGTNILNSLQRILTQYKTNCISNRTLQTELPSLQFAVLESGDYLSNSFVLKVRATYWINNYRNKNYELLNTKLPVNYKIIKYIETDEIVLALRTKNRKEIELGRFKNNKDSELELNTISQDLDKYVIDRLVGGLVLS